MATRLNGNDVRIYAAQTASTPALIAEMESSVLTINNALIDVTTKDSDSWAESITGRKSWTMTGTARLNYSDGGELTSVIELSTLHLAGTMVDLQFGVGNARFEGSAFIESLDHNAPSDEASEFTVNFTGTGPVTYDPDITS